MTFLLGMLIVMGCVFGGFVLSKGQLLALWHPTEVLIIGGAAFGAMVISNSPKDLIAIFKFLPNLLTGGKYNKKLHMELLGLLFEIATKIRKSGLMSLEADIDSPENSELFKNFPNILHHHHAMEFITDNLRLIISGNLSPHDFEAILDHELATHEEEAEKVSGALTKVSDGLPGFGIVAAVLGIVITMSFIGGDPKVLGEKIATALVGTFLGILFAYGFVGPMANAVNLQEKKEIKFFDCIKVFLLSVLAGTPPQLNVEYARRCLYSDVKPSFSEL
ncbi:MAG: flagellar motor stator protein MotA [Gammaproteobacteria bacterium]